LFGTIPRDKPPLHSGEPPEVIKKRTLLVRCGGSLSLLSGGSALVREINFSPTPRDSPEGLFKK